MLVQGLLSESQIHILFFLVRWQWRSFHVRAGKFQGIDCKSMPRVEMHERFVNPRCLQAMHFKKYRWQRGIDTTKPILLSYRCIALWSKFASTSCPNFVRFSNPPEPMNIFSLNIHFINFTGLWKTFLQQQEKHFVPCFGNLKHQS